VTADRLTTEPDRSTTMEHLVHHELARAHVNARLEQARSAHREQRLVRAWRLSRKAERAAARARLALARTL
jgi:hypothetical protein